MPLPDWDELARQRMMHALNRARHHVACRIYRGERMVVDEFTVEQARRDQRPGSRHRIGMLVDPRGAQRWHDWWQPTTERVQVERRPGQLCA